MRSTATRPVTKVTVPSSDAMLARSVTEYGTVTQATSPSPASAGPTQGESAALGSSQETSRIDEINMATTRNAALLFSSEVRSRIDDSPVRTSRGEAPPVRGARPAWSVEAGERSHLFLHLLAHRAVKL